MVMVTIYGQWYVNRDVWEYAGYTDAYCIIL